MKAVYCIVLAFFLLLPSPVLASHPLITDDAGTQGTGKFELELNGEYSRKKDIDDELLERNTLGTAALAYGVTDNLDLSVEVPWLRSDVDDAGQTSTTSGLSDVSLSAKWRWYDRGGLSLALKPGVTLPTGDYEKGLGNGRATESLFLIATRELEPFAFHLNLGYVRNENKGDDRLDLLHASLAAEYAATRLLRLVGDVGTETNPEPGTTTQPAYMLAGAIYSVTASCDIDLGFKFGLNREEELQTVLAGITFRW